MHPFRKLQVWRKAHELVLRTYRVTSTMSSERFRDLRGQMRRAAASIPFTMAEGAGRDTAAQFAHHLEIAIGSARELDYLLLLARDLGALGTSDHARLGARVDEVCAMAVALRKRLREQAGTASAGKARSRNR